MSDSHSNTGVVTVPRVKAGGVTKAKDAKKEQDKAEDILEELTDAAHRAEKEDEEGVEHAFKFCIVTVYPEGGMIDRHFASAKGRGWKGTLVAMADEDIDLLETLTRYMGKKDALAVTAAAIKECGHITSSGPVNITKPPTLVVVREG